MLEKVATEGTTSTAMLDRYPLIADDFRSTIAAGSPENRQRMANLLSYAESSGIIYPDSDQRIGTRQFMQTLHEKSMTRLKAENGVLPGATETEMMDVLRVLREEGALANVKQLLQLEVEDRRKALDTILASFKDQSVEGDVSRDQWFDEIARDLRLDPRRASSREDFEKTVIDFLRRPADDEEHIAFAHLFQLSKNKARLAADMLTTEPYRDLSIGQLLHLPKPLSPQKELEVFPLVSVGQLFRDAEESVQSEARQLTHVFDRIANIYDPGFLKNQAALKNKPEAVAALHNMLKDRTASGVDIAQRDLDKGTMVILEEEIGYLDRMIHGSPYYKSYERTPDELPSMKEVRKLENQNAVRRRDKDGNVLETYINHRVEREKQIIHHMWNIHNLIMGGKVYGSDKKGWVHVGTTKPIDVGGLSFKELFSPESLGGKSFAPTFAPGMWQQIIDHASQLDDLPGSNKVELAPGTQRLDERAAQLTRSVEVDNRARIDRIRQEQKQALEEDQPIDDEVINARLAEAEEAYQAGLKDIQTSLYDDPVERSLYVEYDYRTEKQTFLRQLLADVYQEPINERDNRPANEVLSELRDIFRERGVLPEFFQSKFDDLLPTMSTRFWQEWGDIIKGKPIIKEDFYGTGRLTGVGKKGAIVETPMFFPPGMSGELAGHAGTKSLPPQAKKVQKQALNYVGKVLGQRLFKTRQLLQAAKKEAKEKGGGNENAIALLQERMNVYGKLIDEVEEYAKKGHYQPGPGEEMEKKGLYLKPNTEEAFDWSFDFIKAGETKGKTVKLDDIGKKKIKRTQGGMDLFRERKSDTPKEDLSTQAQLALYVRQVAKEHNLPLVNKDGDALDLNQMMGNIKRCLRAKEKAIKKTK